VSLKFLFTFKPYGITVKPQFMTRKNNNRTENKNTRNNTRKADNTQQELFVHVETDTRIEPAKKSATDLAREKAEAQAKREQERKEREAARELEQKRTAKFLELTMSPNDACRAIAAHTNDALEEGFTVADFMQTYGWEKLTLKGLIAAVTKAAPDLVRDGKLYLPTCKAATYASCEEDKLNGKPVYYFTTKGSGENKHNVWKKAQVYSLEAIKLWTPAVVLRLLKSASTYTERKAHYDKRNAELAKVKKFYVVNDIADKAVNGKVKSEATRTTTYVQVETASVEFPK
jgi:urease gamma subunit